MNTPAANSHGLIVGESQFSGSGVYRGWISLAGFEIVKAATR